MSIWDREIVPALTDYIRIPNKSPAFDPEWEAHGYMDKAVALFADWAKDKLQALPGAVLGGGAPAGPHAADLHRSAGHRRPAPILMYGHLDKQPEMTGWAEAPGPGSRCSRTTSFMAAAAPMTAMPCSPRWRRCWRCTSRASPMPARVILIEACEESGSHDLPFYVDHLAARHRHARPGGLPGFGLRQLRSALADHIAARHGWSATLTVRVLTEGVHSGDASGVVPSSFRIAAPASCRGSRTRPPARSSRPTCSCRFPPEPHRAGQGRRRGIWATRSITKLPFVPGMQPVADDPAELILNRTWRPQLAITGMDGFPRRRMRGNVLLPYTTPKLSLAPAADSATPKPRARR